MVELPRGEGSVVEYLGVFEPKRMMIDYWDLCIASSVTEGMRKLLVQSQCSLQRFDVYRTATACWFLIGTEYAFQH